MSVFIVKLFKGKIPKISFQKAKEKILGKKYELEIIFAAPKLMKNLNKAYRGKSGSTNVLSFSLNKEMGELFLDLNEIKKEASRAGIESGAYFLRIFIHGLLHLKGLDHGRRMVLKEKKFFKLFESDAKEYNSRDRHRI